MYKLCSATEQSNAVNAEQKTRYENQAKLMDDVVPRSLKMAVNGILTVGLATGLANLRQATRGNARPVLLESGAVDFVAPFLQQVEIEGMNISAEDVALYSDREQVRQEETLARLEACEDVYSMKAESTFIEGAKAVSMHSLTLRQQAEAEKAVVGVKSSSTSDGSWEPMPAPGEWTPVPAPPPPAFGGGGGGGMSAGAFIMTAIFGGILSFVYIYAISMIAIVAMFLAAMAQSGLLVFLVGAAWMFLTVSGVVSIFRFAGWLFGSAFNARTAKKAEQCMRSVGAPSS